MQRREREHGVWNINFKFDTGIFFNKASSVDKVQMMKRHQQPSNNHNTSRLHHAATSSKNLLKRKLLFPRYARYPGC